MENQPIINIGCLGSVSDGKSTLVKVLTGIRTQKHSNEKIRNITIKQGYGNLKIYEKDNKYSCENIDNDSILKNHISFVDCPGHQEFIQTMLGSISLMDGAIIVIAVNQPLINKPQLIQHLAAAKIGKLDKIIICLNKIDLVKKSILFKYKLELDKILKEYEITPHIIIPTCFNKNIGINYLLSAIMELFNPASYLDRINKKSLFNISRSFDINKVGINYNNVVGGVIGGSLSAGKFKINDIIEIRPGYVSKNISKPIITKILSIKTDTTFLDEIIPGGLIAIGTDIDPFYCKNDMLVGNVIGLKDELPPIYTNIELNLKIITLFGYKWEPKIKDNVVLQIGTRICDAILTKIQDKYYFELLKPVCIEDNQYIIICYNINKILKIVAHSY